MSSKLYVAIGLIVYIALVGWFTLKSIFPQKDEVESRVSKIEVFSEEKLKDPIVSKLKEPGQYVQFGNIPVTISKEEQGKENPFQ